MRFFPSPLLICGLALALAGGALPVRGSTIVFNDGFESPNIDPFWTVSQSFGSMRIPTKPISIPG
jgi:hypothetical protein